AAARRRSDIPLRRRSRLEPQRTAHRGKGAEHVWRGLANLGLERSNGTRARAFDSLALPRVELAIGPRRHAPRERRMAGFVLRDRAHRAPNRGIDFMLRLPRREEGTE